MYRAYRVCSRNFDGRHKDSNRDPLILLRTELTSVSQVEDR